MINTPVSKNLPNQRLDTTGLICPEPVMLLHRAVRKASAGDCIEVIATDPSSWRDIPKFCMHLGHDLVKQEKDIDDSGVERFIYCVVKGER